MATSKTKAQQREDAAKAAEPYEAPKAAQQATEAGQEEAVSQAEPHPPTEPRKTAPQAPRVTSGDSPVRVTQIRELLAEALYSRHPEAIQAGIEKIAAVPTMKSHPQVAIYKAEVLDHLRSKIS